MTNLKASAARLFTLLALTLASMAGAQQPGAQSPGAQQPAGARDCSALAREDYPKASISNGVVDAVLYLPDAAHGYYRATRFDWSGVIPCLAFKGHTYFGVWFPHYDPMLADSITGPVEEFHSEDGGLGYALAKPGELFVKIGVGVVRKEKDAPYFFMYPYPLVDGGKWTVHASHRGVAFRQRLKSPIGYAYDYKKTVTLDAHSPVLVLHHTLKNTGTKAIETDVYDHDFFMLDGATTGPGMVVRFPFAPKAVESMEPLAGIDGQQIVYRTELQPKQFVQSVLTGYSASPADYDFIVEDTRTGVGVEQTGDHPLARINYWSPRTTICPEAYYHLSIAPGQTAQWDIRYRFYAK